MDRGAWQATVREVVRVRYDLGTKPPPQRNRPQKFFSFSNEKKFP